MLNKGEVTQVYRQDRRSSSMGESSGRSVGVQPTYRTIPLTLTSDPVAVQSGDNLKITVSARRTCSGSGHASGAPRLWYDGAPIDSGATRDAGTRFGATIGGSPVTDYLRTGFGLSATPGSSRTFIDKFVDSSAPCAARPFTDFGSWTMPMP